MIEHKLFKFDKNHLDTPFIIYAAKAAKKPNKRFGQMPIEFIYCDGKRIIGTDGRRLHIFTPDECPLPVGMFSVEKITKTQINISCCEYSNGHIDSYPDVDKVIPERTNVVEFDNSGTPARYAQVLRAMDKGTFNINYFNDANSIDQITKFQALDEYKPLSIYGCNLLAIIMPMR